MKTTKKVRTKSSWVKVGEIGVDAGLVWIGDPCYVLHRQGEDKPKSIGKDWEDFCNKLGLFERMHGGPAMKSFSYDMGHEGLGVCVSSGFGDGCYDVMARVEKIGRWGKRVCEIKIVFIKPSERRKEKR
ncbi:MAG: hypothetical protein WC683_02615 [bacterium]